MKKIYLNVFISTFFVFLGLSHAQAQTLKIDVTYKETFNSYSGQVESSDAIHAIGGGKVSCAVSDVTVPSDAKVDSILVSMSGQPEPVKLVSTSGTASFDILDSDEVAEYNFLAELFYSDGDKSYNKTFNADKRVKVYPVPTLPSLEEVGGTSEIYEAGQSGIMMRSVTPGSGGNDAGWSYTWKVTPIDNGAKETIEEFTGNTLNYDVDTKFSNDIPTIRTYEIEFEYANVDPVNGQDWISGKLNGFNACKIYNVPACQPKNLGHYKDEGSDQDYYLAMNAGISDEMISSNEYVFCFTDSDGHAVYSTSRRIDAGKYDYDNVYALWTYDDGYSAPSDISSLNVKKLDLRINYECNVQLTPGRHEDDSRYLQQSIEKDNVLNYFSGAQAMISHAVSGFGFELEDARVSSYLGEVCGTIESTSGTNIWKDLKAGEYGVELDIVGTIEVDNNVKYDVNGTYISEIGVKIWEEPTLSTGTPQNIIASDIQIPNFTLNMSRPEGGVDDSWSWDWTRICTTDGSEEKVGMDLTYSEEEAITDPSEEKNIRTFMYVFSYKNVGPDNSTVWFNESEEMGSVTIYNAPNTPGSLLYLSGEGETIIAATNLGLSDEQIVDRDYKFQYQSGNISETIDHTRFYTGSNSPEKVASLWKYDDGYEVFSDWADKTIANPREELIVSTEVNEVPFYKGSVSNGNDIYVLSGSKVNLMVEIDNNYIVEGANISVNGDNQPDQTAINGNGAVRTYYPIADEVTKCNFKVTLDVCPIFDYYILDGKTEYIKASAPVTMNALDYNETVHIYPQPVYPDIEVQAISSVDIDQDSYNFNIDAVTGGNNNQWHYRWQCIDPSKTYDLVEDGMECNMGPLPEIDGAAPKVENYIVRVNVTNESPVAGQYWVDGNINIADINIYNSPNPVGRMMRYVNNENVYYVACEVGCSDQMLDEYGYKFLFSSDYEESVVTKRSYASSDQNIKAVRSVFDYPEDLNHSAFRVVSADVELDGETSPKFNSKMEVIKSDYDGIHNYSYRQNSEGIYVLASTIVKYTLGIDGNSTDYYIESGQLENGEVLSSSILELERAYNSEGQYLETVNGKLSYRVETGLASDAFTTLPFDYTYPAPQANVHVYPRPHFPEEVVVTYTKFRDIDPVRPLGYELTETYFGGNTNGWDYNWWFDDREIGHDMVVEAQQIDGEGMATVQHVVKYRWSNQSPARGDNSAWLKGETDYVVTVYNTPEKPTKFVKKGNGVSGIYIVNEMPYDDSRLAQLNYQFQFGDNDTVEDNAISTEQIGRRWYTYNSANKPWVRSAWAYDDFICYSDYTICSSSRSGLTIADLYEYEGDDMKIYTIDGSVIRGCKLKDLAAGVYIVEAGTGEDKMVEKIYVK